MSPTAIVAYLALFTAAGASFLFINLLVGKFLRPDAPNVEKKEVYECGEPTIGSSFVQFDLRFYVIALLFIIFDVEIAFFFPWATVFGKATHLMDPNLAAEHRLIREPPAGTPGKFELNPAYLEIQRELGVPVSAMGLSELPAAGNEGVGRELARIKARADVAKIQDRAALLARMSIADILVFFGVLMMGFAYVWRRGDLDWVRAVTGEQAAPVKRTIPGLGRGATGLGQLKSMPSPNLLDRLKQKFGDMITGANLDALDPWIEVSPEAIAEVGEWLRDEPTLRFNFLNCISGVDYFEPDPKKAAKTGWEPHFEVVYHLWSLSNKVSLVLKVILPRWKNDVPGQLPEVPTVSGVWSTADWHEREVYDLSGVRFKGHPNLRRILCPEDWVGHPLRKDYEQPLEYHGIRGR